MIIIDLKIMLKIQRNWASTVINVNKNENSEVYVITVEKAMGVFFYIASILATEIIWPQIQLICDMSWGRLCSFVIEHLLLSSAPS